VQSRVRVPSPSSSNATTKNAAHQALRITQLETELFEVRDHSYRTEVDYVNQIKTLQATNESKSQRIAALEALQPDTNSVHFTAAEKMKAELQIAKYKLDNQASAIRRLETQLRQQASNSNAHNEAFNSDATPRLSKTVDRVDTSVEHKPSLDKTIAQIHNVTIELLESLELITPNLAGQVRSSAHTDSGRLEFISRGYSHISESIKLSTAEFQSLEKKKEVLDSEIREAVRQLEALRRQIAVSRKELYAKSKDMPEERSKLVNSDRATATRAETTQLPAGWQDKTPDRTETGKHSKVLKSKLARLADLKRELGSIEKMINDQV
jgi:hypothetical protein